MAKVKITSNVTIGGAIHKEGETPDLNPTHAKALISGGFAEEYKEPAPAPKNPTGNPNGSNGNGTGNGAQQ